MASSGMLHRVALVRTSIEFVQVLSSLHVNTRDIMISFDIVSLFTRVPIKGTMDLLGRHFEEDALGLFCHVLTTSYFSFVSYKSNKA
jgi:hypothetical protein